VAACASSQDGNPGGTGGSGGSQGVVISGEGGSTQAGQGGTAGSSAAGSGGTAGNAGTAGGTGGATPPPEPQLVTSAQGSFWQTGTLTQVTGGTADVTVNDTTVLQTFNGFGGTFNEAGWVALSVLSPDAQKAAIKLLFDANDGAHFVFGRIPIGASDYAAARYTLDENPGDTTMAKFSVDHDKTNLIPYIQAALDMNPGLHLWAGPWTPPTWMKSNGTFDGGNMKEDQTDFQALALYLARFVEEYGKLGINIETIYPQNEPGYSTRYPSCLWTAAGMTTFIKTYLAPTFAMRGVPANIYLGTMSNADAGKDGTIISTVDADTMAAGDVKGYELQWNMLPSVSGLKSRNLQIVQSEHKCGNYPWNPSGFPAFNPNKPPNDYAYGVESWGYIRDWIQAGVNVYSAWNMVLDTAGKNLDSQQPWPQNALLVVDTTAKTLTATPAYFVFRHVSQYVDPGAQVVATSPSTNKDVLAFKNPDGTIVVVIYNSGAAKMMTVALAGTRVQFAMPANGWATVNWK
jgi:glucosylceramidase